MPGRRTQSWSRSVAMAEWLALSLVSREGCANNMVSPRPELPYQPTPLESSPPGGFLLLLLAPSVVSPGARDLPNTGRVVEVARASTSVTSTGRSR